MDGPSVGIPLTACGSLCLGFLLLYISLFTLTIPHWSFPYLRLVLAPPAVLYFWDFGYGPYESPTRTVSAGMSTVGLYGIMRVLEHSVISLWDLTPPHWVMRTQSAKGTSTVLASPGTSRERCIYALDILTSLRGSSWFADLEWSWISRSLRSSLPSLSRRQFIAKNITTLITQFLLFDLCDTLNKSRIWDAESPNAVTSLPILQQLIFSISVCTGTAISITIPYTLLSSISVLCGSSPSSWPPMFDSPFLSKSLMEFWSRRWHRMFRRVFERLSVPLVNLPLLILARNVHHNKRIISVMRSSITFALSTLLHLIIMHRLALQESYRNGRIDDSSFLDPSILGFFLCQPLGLLLESTLVFPFALWMFPVMEAPDNQVQASHTHPITGASPQNGHAKGSSKPCPATPSANGNSASSRWKREAVTRLYAWVFLIWTGRWWADKWVRVGLWDEREKVVPFSIWRGLMDGHWIV